MTDKEYLDGYEKWKKLYDYVIDIYDNGLPRNMTAATVNELRRILEGKQSTTISGDAIKILDKFKILYKAEGIGWTFAKD